MPTLAIEFTNIERERPAYPYPFTDSRIEMPFGFDYKEANQNFLQARYANISSLKLAYVLSDRREPEVNEFDTCISAFPELKSFELRCTREINIDQLFHIIRQLPTTLESLTLSDWGWCELSPENARELFSLISAACPDLTSLKLPASMYDALYRGLLEKLPHGGNELNEEALQRALREHLPQRLKHMMVSTPNNFLTTQHPVLIKHAMKLFKLQSLGVNPDSIEGDKDEKVGFIQTLVANRHLSLLQLTSSKEELPLEAWLIALNDLKDRHLEHLDLSNNLSYRRLQADDWRQLFAELSLVDTLNLSGIFNNEEELRTVLAYEPPVRSLILQESQLTQITQTLITSFHQLEHLKEIDLSNNFSGMRPTLVSARLFIRLFGEYHLKVDWPYFNELSMLNVSELQILLDELPVSASLTVEDKQLRAPQIREVLIRMIMLHLIDDLEFPQRLQNHLQPKKDAMRQALYNAEPVEVLRGVYEHHFGGLRIENTQATFYSAGRDVLKKFDSYLCQLAECQQSYDPSSHKRVG